MPLKITPEPCNHAYALQVSSGSITGAHVEDQQGVKMQRPDKPLQSLDKILDLSPKQAAKFPRQHTKSANAGFHPAQQGITHGYPLPLSPDATQLPAPHQQPGH